ncbi:hypothetical protein [Pseudomonas mandelii]|uniref:Uncharacterized protein n=1 Tax=Pseudomonas mandelii TaxID=75612 RepID=A0ABY0VVV4_9PSED|nr:hypothetical protein [Pseudomonas mandelii]TWS07976.1 hypothetical protein FJD35_24015 [Pseudomonas mandelii]SDU58313.1 hypothetical protein SAMN04489801_4709 [Pseudomonas mandelii]
MSDSNKEKFNDLVYKIMSLLIDACPVHRSIGPADFGYPEGETDPESCYYIPAADEAFLYECIRWLKDEELIRGEHEYVATIYGLEMFNGLPECLKTN